MIIGHLALKMKPELRFSVFQVLNPITIVAVGSRGVYLARQEFQTGNPGKNRLSRRTFAGTRRHVASPSWRARWWRQGASAMRIVPGPPGRSV